MKDFRKFTGAEPGSKMFQVRRSECDLRIHYTQEATKKDNSYDAVVHILACEAGT